MLKPYVIHTGKTPEGNVPYQWKELQESGPLEEPINLGERHVHGETSVYFRI